MRDIVDFIYDDYRQVLLAPHKRMDIIVGSLLMTGAASVKNKDDNAGGIDLLNIDLPFKFIKPDTEDKDYFVTYLQQKLNELKSIYGTFPKMIMSRGTFFELKKTTITKPDGSVLVTTTTKVTGKGQIYFVEKFLGKDAA